MRQNNLQSALQVLEKRVAKSGKKKIKYRHDRFEPFFKEALSLYDQKKYKKAINKSLLYFDKTFGYTSKGIDIIIKSYQSLGDKENVELYKEIKIFYTLMLEAKDIKKIRDSYQVLKTFKQKHNDCEFLTLLIYSYELIYKKHQKFFKNKRLQIFPLFLKMLSDIWEKNRIIHNYKERYSELFKEDFYKKPVFFLLLAGKYHIPHLVTEVLTYEEVFDTRRSIPSTHHSAYNFLCNTDRIKDEEKFYYYIKSLQYDIHNLRKYKKDLVRLFFILKFFLEQQSVQAFSDLFPREIALFFQELHTLRENDFDTIKNIVKIYKKTKSFSLIPEKELVQYLYSIIQREDKQFLYKKLKQYKLTTIFRKYIVDIDCLCRDKKKEKIESMKKIYKKIISSNLQIILLTISATMLFSFLVGLVLLFLSIS